MNFDQEFEKLTSKMEVNQTPDNASDKVNEESQGEQSLLGDLVQEFGEKKKDKIKASLKAYRNGFYEFSVDGDDYNAFQNEKIAEQQALIKMQDYLKEYGPEGIAEWAIKKHLYVSDTDKRLISGDDADSRMDGMTNKEIYKELGIKEGDIPVKDAREKLQDKFYNETYELLAKEPLKYFSEFMSNDEIMKELYDQTGSLNVDEIALSKEIIDNDGWKAHISSYTDKPKNTKSGWIYIQV